MSNVCVIGSGYVGLTTAACFAHLGHTVVCTDLLPDRVEQLSRGESPILEQGLERLLQEGLAGGRLRFEVGNAAAAHAEFVYLCVPTPQALDGSADLSYIEAAAGEIGPIIEPDTVVINKSTVPVGSSWVVERVLGRSDVHVVSNPEFLREGTAVHDFLNPDRIVIGADDQSAAVRVASLYLGIAAPLIVTDPASAETIKYAANAFLATKISFVNAVAAVCEAVGADMNDVVLGMGYDRRIGSEFLRPGPGWGGSCFVGSETLLVRRSGRVRLVRFEDVTAEVERDGADGWEALSWEPGQPTPVFLPVARFSSRPYDGDVVKVRTKMGRRLTVTADHPCVTRRGVVLASELTTDDWVPVAQGAPLVVDDPANPGYGHVLDAVDAAGLEPGQVIVRLDGLQRSLLAQRIVELPPARRRDAARSGTLRLSELRRLRVPTLRGRFGTTTNGTYVPDVISFDADFWRVVGLWLAEGFVGSDGSRRRLTWCFAPRGEDDLVDFVAGYCRSLGVTAHVYDRPTTRSVSVSSRLLAAWFEHVLGTGRTAYDKRLPDAIWSAPDVDKQALLRGLWDGDGSWSYVAGGPSVVLEYGTVSRVLADGMVRLLGDLGVVARLKVGRMAKSTVDTYWLIISGADQIERALFLLPEGERDEVRRAMARQAKRIAPTGYRRDDDEKAVAWVRVVEVERAPYAGTVHSLTVPGSHTVVTSFGLVSHNCFPKDSRALVRIAEDAGYDFDLLKGVITVNEDQFDRVARKVVDLAGGSVDGVTIAAWGLTFKARTDDLRDSPALAIIERLRRAGAKVQAYDPSVPDGHVDARRASLVEGIELSADPYAACEGATVLVVLTEWDEFRWLDFDKVAGALAERRVVDARNLLDREALRRRGFVYTGVGRV